MNAEPTAFDVLSAHQRVGDSGWCAADDCDWHPTYGRGGLAEIQFARHQADMLAAAGLLATPERDTQVAAQTLIDAAAGARSDLGITSGSRIEVGARAADWLSARAGRMVAEQGNSTP